MRILNLVCGIFGLLIVLFGLLVRTGMIGSVEAQRGMVPILLGLVIVVWSLLMRRRYR